MSSLPPHRAGEQAVDIRSTKAQLRLTHLILAHPFASLHYFASANLPRGHPLIPFPFVSWHYLMVLSHHPIPPSSLLLPARYVVHLTRHSASTWWVSLGGTGVEVAVRKRADGGFLLQLDGASHLVHTEEEPAGTRLLINGLTVLMAKEADPSVLMAPSPGRWVFRLMEHNQQWGQSIAPSFLRVDACLVPYGRAFTWCFCCCQQGWAKHTVCVVFGGGALQGKPGTRVQDPCL